MNISKYVDSLSGLDSRERPAAPTRRAREALSTLKHSLGTTAQQPSRLPHIGDGGVARLPASAQTRRPRCPGSKLSPGITCPSLYMGRGGRGGTALPSQPLPAEAAKGFWETMTAPP